MQLNKQLVLTNTAITVDGASAGASYAIPFGNPLVYNSEEIGFFTISGTPTLANSLSITNTGTPSAKFVMTFVSSAVINLNSNTLTIFGLSLTQTQVSKNFVVTVTYDGSNFTAVLSQTEIPTTGVTNGMLEPMPAYTVKMNSGGTVTVPQNVTFEQFRQSLNVENDLINCVVDFNSGYIPLGGTIRQDIYLPYKGEVTRVFGTITQTVPTDNATIQLGIAGSAGGGFADFTTIVISSGTVVGNYVLDASPSSPEKIFNSGNYLVLEGSKSTWGGRILFTIVTKRT